MVADRFAPSLRRTPAGRLEPVESPAANTPSDAARGRKGGKRGSRERPGGVRGGRSLPRGDTRRAKRVPRELSIGELAVVAPVNPFSDLPGGGNVVPFADELGLDLQQAAKDSGAEARAKVLRWLDRSIRTRPTKANPDGNARCGRVAHCGSLYAARCDGSMGLAHKWCRDRMCPACMERRQRTESKLLRAWVRSRIDAGATILFPTLTQIKQNVEHETCKQAIDRLYTTRRAMMNLKTAAGRALRRFVAGGIWYCEVTWSYKGKAHYNRQGDVCGRVLEDGWHPHLHGLVELTSPPVELVGKLGRDRAGQVWSRMAASAIRKAWMAENPEGSYDAQKVIEVEEARVGQVCKYPLKPFAMAAAKRSREAAVSLVARRTNDAWGTWTHKAKEPKRKSWRPLAEAMLAEQREAAGIPEQAPIVFGDATFQGVAVRAQTGDRVYFGFDDDVGVPSVDVLAAIQREPRSFQRQAADNRAAWELKARGPPEDPRSATVDGPKEAG